MTFLILINYATALQDVNITIRNTKGLCFYSDDVDCQYCDNETLTLLGTKDHLIHLSPQKPYSNCGDIGLNQTETIDTYINPVFVTQAFIVGGFFAVFLGWLIKVKSTRGI